MFRRYTERKLVRQERNNIIYKLLKVSEDKSKFGLVWLKVMIFVT